MSIMINPSRQRWLRRQVYRRPAWNQTLSRAKSRLAVFAGSPRRGRCMETDQQTVFRRDMSLAAEE
jgi:hypothetical protein